MLSNLVWDAMPYRRSPSILNWYCLFLNAIQIFVTHLFFDTNRVWVLDGICVFDTI